MYAWGMIKKMGGDRREWEYSVLTSKEEIAISTRKKAELMVKTFADIHSSGTLHAM